MLEFVLTRYNYWIVIILMMAGLYVVFSRGNLVKKLIGLNLFQTSVFIFYITVSKVMGGTAPILVGSYKDKGGHHGEGHGGGHGDDHAKAGDHAAEVVSDHHGDAGHAQDAAAMVGEGHADVIYSNPLPHVLILTAIVVGVATTALGLSLAVRIREAYGTVEEDNLDAMDNADEASEAAA